MPITWRNVEAPNLTDASRILSGAGNAFQAGISTLGDLLKGVQTTNDRNFEVQKANNTEAFLADLTSRYQTPEQYQAALASGEVNGTLAAAGPQIDKTAARRFLDDRLGTLTQRQTAQNAYQDQTTDRLMRPMVEQVKALAAKGDVKGAEAMMAANPGLQRYMGDLTKAAVDGGRAAEEFGLKKSADARAEFQLNDTIATNRAQRDHIAEQDKIGWARLGLDKERMAVEASMARTGNAKLVTDALKVRFDKQMEGNPYKDGALTKDTIPSLAKDLNNVVFSTDKLQQQRIVSEMLKAATKLAQDGQKISYTKADGTKVNETIPLALSDVKAAMMSESFDWTDIRNARPAERFVSTIQKLAENKMESRSAVDLGGYKIPRKDEQVNPLMEHYLAYQAMTSKLSDDMLATAQQAQGARAKLKLSSGK